MDFLRFILIVGVLIDLPRETGYGRVGRERLIARACTEKRQYPIVLRSPCFLQVRDALLIPRGP